ncbi:MAG: MarR family winged helix-turn-helix transcriptional regulator [Mycobacterium sp.]
MSDDGGQPLGYLLHRLNSALRTEVTGGALEPAGVSFPQYICMRILSLQPGWSNADLAREVGVSPQAMNMVIRSLQESGLVARPATVASGRSLPAALTREGAATLARIDIEVRNAELRVLAPLTDAQRGEFRELLSRLV